MFWMTLRWLSQDNLSLIILNYSFLRSLFLLVSGPVVLCRLASTSVPWSEEDTVFCWETAEAFPPLQTVFPLCAFWLEEMRQQKRRWQQPFSFFVFFFTHPSYLLFSFIQVQTTCDRRINVRKAPSPVVESFDDLLISLVKSISVSKRQCSLQNLKWCLKAWQSTSIH